MRKQELAAAASKRFTDVLAWKAIGLQRGKGMTRCPGQRDESEACAVEHDKLIAYLRALPDPERLALISNGGYGRLQRSAVVDEWHASGLRRIADALDVVPESVYENAGAHGLSRGDLAAAFMNTRREAKEFERRVALGRKVRALESGTGLSALVSLWQATNKQGSHPYLHCRDSRH